MKALDELGISPTPWELDKWYDVNDQNGNTIAFALESRGNSREQDVENAQMMAAAPRLYEALREAVIESCYECPKCECADGYRCIATKGNCSVMKWRAALAAASGEETGK